MLIKNAIKFANLIKESATIAATPRKNMKKIHQMGKQDFVMFIKALNSKLRGTSLDLTDLKVTEKVDGQAMRLGVLNGMIGAETSSSGLVFKPYKLSQDGHTKLLKHFQTRYNDEMLSIADKFGDFKVIGELFYIKDSSMLDDDGSVTFVATKYDSRKLGKLGAIILFDAEGIDNETTVKIPQDKKDALISSVKKLSDDTFKVFDKNEISWNGSFDIKAAFNTPEAKNAFENPDSILKMPKENFEVLKNAVAEAFSAEIHKNGSVLGLPGSIVEGIVFEINGNKFGATNFSWKTKKEEILKSQNDFQKAIDDFYKSIFGTIYTAKVKAAAENEPEKFQSDYAQKLPKLKQQLSDIMDSFSSLDIPRNIKFKLKIILGSRYTKFMKLTEDISSLVAMLTPKR